MSALHTKAGRENQRRKLMGEALYDAGSGGSKSETAEGGKCYSLLSGMNKNEKGSGTKRKLRQARISKKWEVTMNLLTCKNINRFRHGGGKKGWRKLPEGEEIEIHTKGKRSEEVLGGEIERLLKSDRSGG